jgi:hypothetical protein
MSTEKARQSPKRSIPKQPPCSTSRSAVGEVFANSSPRNCSRIGASARVARGLHSFVQEVSGPSGKWGKSTEDLREGSLCARNCTFLDWASAGWWSGSSRDTWDHMFQQGIQLLERFTQEVTHPPRAASESSLIWLPAAPGEAWCRAVLLYPPTAQHRYPTA